MPSLLRLSGGRVLRGLALWFTAVSLAVVARATIGAPLQTQLGNPSSATTDPANHAHYLITRDQYGLDYADATRQPNWVSWDLTTADIGASGRSSFIQDTTLPAGFYQVLTTDYSGSGYDRGHMCPSADRTITTFDNQQVFYMSNMVPQAPDNNQGVWANFESYCRSLASAGNELLITCGPSGFSGSTIASGVAIPGYTWKIVVVVPNGVGSAVSRITASTRVIAIKVPNTAGVRTTPWQNFVTSAAQIEADTGYTFFANLPAATRAALRTVVDGQSAAGTPAIVAQPTNQTTVVGGSATFTVSASGDAPLSYQWYTGDDQPIAGATDATLTLANVQAADLGTYYVVVTNPLGTATSNPASLVIMGLAPTITTSPSSDTANAGTNVTFAVAASGSPTLTYQWRKDTQPIAGATTATLTLTNIQAATAGSYDVVVTNATGFATSAAALLTVVDVAPTITVPPASRAATTGSNASFTVTAAGTAPLSYVWRKDGAPLSDGGAYSGTATATLVLTSVSAVNAGSYDVIVSNALGTTPSAPATLTVNPPAPSVVYWDFGNATTGATAAPTSGLPSDVTGGTFTQNNNLGTSTMLTATSVSGSYSGASGSYNVCATARPGALSPAASGSAYFEFTLTPAAGKRLYVSGLSFGTRSTSTGPQAWALFTSLDNYAAPVASGSISNTSAWTLVNPALSPVTSATGTGVTFRLYGYNGVGTPTSGQANWRIDDVKLQVATLFPPPVTPTVTGTSPASGATNVPNTSAITVAFNEAVSFTGNWFTISSALNGPLSAAVTGGPTTFTLTPPSFFGYNDTITVTIHANQVVDQASGSMRGSGDTTFSFSTQSYVPPTPPTVTTQPVAQAINVGDTATFTVAASGTAPFTYQWRKGGLPVSGNASATTATLTVANASTTDAGSYDCVVSNAAGSDVSHAATLMVNLVPPSIATAPAAQGALEGGSASFSVVPAGTGPFSYRWRKNGVPLSDGPGVAGATSPALTLSALTYADSGSVDVVVTNAVTSVTSTPAVLAVFGAAPSVVTWDFATADPTSGLPAGVTGGTVTQGNNNGTTTMLSASAVSTGYTGATGGNNAGLAARIGALNTGAAGSAYFEVTFTPPAGRRFAATALSFGARSTGTGPKAFTVFSSADNFTTPIAAGTLLADSVWRLLTPTFSGAAASSGAPVTFRIYGYNGSGNAGAGQANWRVDDVKLTAGLLAEPLPPVLTQTPSDQTATVGDTVTFTVAASGTAPFTYQWRKDGQPLTANSSAITPTLTLPSITTADAGAYECVVTNVAGFATSTPVALTVNKATVAVTLGTLAFTYDGTAHATTATTAPAGYNVVITYDGASAGPVNAGSYAVAATVDDPNYTGTASGTLVIARAPASVALANLSQVYSGAPRVASATTLPAGLAVAFTYDGSPAAPVHAGTYAVTATVIDPNYSGATSGSLVVSRAAASIALSALNPTYTGSPLPATVTTTPAGLATAVTYDGAATVPTDAGAYAVAASITDPDYAGSATGTLVIGKAAATVTLAGLHQTFDGAAKAATATTTPAGLNVVLTYDGSATAPTNAGSYAVSATVQARNYAGGATGTLVIAPADATLTLTKLTQWYDGTPRAVEATVTPSGLPVAITYDGGNDAPTYPGTYAVSAHVTDANYSATATGTLTVAITALVRHAPTLSGGLDGSVQQLLPESTTLNGSAWVSGDLLVPGTPVVTTNARATYGGTRDALGAESPAGYSIALNGGTTLRHVVRRVDALALPVAPAPAAPTGTRSVSLSGGQTVGDFATLRNLTLNANVGAVAVPAGTYGDFVVNRASAFVLGVAGATEPSVYEFQSLTVNAGATVQVVGPVIVRLARGTSLSGTAGAPEHPEWLRLTVASGDVTINGNATLNGTVIAPTGTVTVNGTLTGSTASDRLILNGNGQLTQP